LGGEEGCLAPGMHCPAPIGDKEKDSSGKGTRLVATHAWHLQASTRWVGLQLVDSRQPVQLLLSLHASVAGSAALLTWNLLFASGSSGCLSGWHCKGHGQKWVNAEHAACRRTQNREM